MDLPIACTLTETARRERRQTIMDSFRRIGVTVAELPDGYAYTFPATSEAFMQITQLVDMERECCPFLNFKIVVEAGKEPMRLEITGPNEAKSVIANFFIAFL
ncbi:MAG: hypothetical protein DMG15_28625 [Acidobacteria bacterium]|nr:MAG: hypothetical protein DMG16_19615 [Acidobacteriota bacterium]PYS07964.1 MAG: hypothetical protein DMG15_28625 [Acidobacteriota bacterium]